MVSASDDASFRRYFRLIHQGGSVICVDAPPQQEDNDSFVKIQSMLEAAGVAVPKVISSDLNRGYLLLSDLGDELLLNDLKVSEPDKQRALYEQAIDSLGGILRADGQQLATYSEDKLREEMSLFPDWFLSRQLGIDLYHGFEDIMSLMVDNALSQPRIFVHRDFHARNLMPQDDGSLAIIDFQDAVYGPITYDLVSLLKDCYWRLDRSQVIELVEKYRLKHCQSESPERFLKWFDWMGFQRHLKCAGIFSRLNLRDGKPGYLNDIPLVIAYLVEVAELYDELAEFGEWLKREVQQRLVAQLAAEA